MVPKVFRKQREKLKWFIVCKIKPEERCKDWLIAKIVLIFMKLFERAGER